jgi:hypothetical protein
MQPTIHLEGKAGYGGGKCPALSSKCIVCCIFFSVGIIITREIPCISEGPWFLDNQLITFLVQHEYTRIIITHFVAVSCRFQLRNV